MNSIVPPSLLSVDPLPMFLVGTTAAAIPSHLSPPALLHLLLLSLLLLPAHAHSKLTVDSCVSPSKAKVSSINVCYWFLLRLRGRASHNDIKGAEEQQLTVWRLEHYWCHWHNCLWHCLQQFNKNGKGWHQLQIPSSSDDATLVIFAFGISKLHQCPCPPSPLPRATPSYEATATRHTTTSLVIISHPNCKGFPCRTCLDQIA